jgi:hypothetical protein
MEKVLEPRREWWTQVTAWAACILYRAENDERWQEFYAMASAMVQGRALRVCPETLGWIAEFSEHEAD